MNPDIELFNFKFDEVIIYQLDLLNSVLKELNKSPIFENTDFEINKESAGTYFLRISLSKTESDKLPIDILFEGNGMRLDVFHLSESFEWSKDIIFSTKNEIIIFFKQLFTSYVLIESCGSPYSKSRMYLFDESGNLINKYILRGVIHNFSGWNCDKSLFFPIYPAE